MRSRGAFCAAASATLECAPHLNRQGARDHLHLFVEVCANWLVPTVLSCRADTLFALMTICFAADFAWERTAIKQPTHNAAPVARESTETIFVFWHDLCISSPHVNREFRPPTVLG
jgi:hypothetical protein